MNRFFLMVLLLLYSCSSDNEREINISLDEIVFSWKKETKNIAIKDGEQWFVESKTPEWLSIDNIIIDSLSITAQENNTTALRTCQIKINSSKGDIKEFTVSQKSKEKLFFEGDKEYLIDNSADTLTIGIDQTIDYKVSISDSAKLWINQVNNKIIGNINPFNKYSLCLQINENRETEERYAKVVIYNDIYNISDTLHITQKRAENSHYKDGEYIQIQKATKGNVNIIIMGDGFIRKDMTADSRYEKIMRQTADYFFSIEPYKSYRDYFNVYMIFAESKEEGVSEKSTGKKVSNKFGSTYGEGTEITCNSDLCLKYADKIEGLPKTVIVVLNSNKYAGTTYMYAGGNSIALCPMSEKESPNDFEGLIHHEACGHGFGFLCDEYVYYKQEIPESRKQDIKDWQKIGFLKNLDFTSDKHTVLWKDFIGVEKYISVGTYEGGDLYQYKIWRSEVNSCMNNNIPYFNVQSRWNIVDRIMKLSNIKFNIYDFIKADIPSYRIENALSVPDGKFIPLGNPILIK